MDDDDGPRFSLVLRSMKSSVSLYSAGSCRIEYYFHTTLQSENVMLNYGWWPDRRQSTFHSQREARSTSPAELTQPILVC